MTQRQHIRIFATPEHDCPYLDGRKETTGFIDPAFPMNMAVYSELVSMGYRRSGDHVYRPFCQQCTACVATRIRVDDFSPDRSQRRVMQRNSDLQVSIGRELTQEHLDLYGRYLASRHPDSGMNEGGRDAAERFFFAQWCDTQLLEVRNQERLLAVAVTDLLMDGVSAVYTFFDPDCSERSPGVFCIMQQIQMAKRLGQPYCYLGYWVEDCAKMNYKVRYKPIEGWDGSQWRTLPFAQTI